MAMGVRRKARQVRGSWDWVQYSGETRGWGRVPATLEGVRERLEGLRAGAEATRVIVGPRLGRGMGGGGGTTRELSERRGRVRGGGGGGGGGKTRELWERGGGVL